LFPLLFIVLLQFTWRRGSKDSRAQGFKGLFFRRFISVFDSFSSLAVHQQTISQLLSNLDDDKRVTKIVKEKT